MNSTDRQLLTKEITMEFIRKTPYDSVVDIEEINSLVDNIIGEEKKGFDDKLHSLGSTTLAGLVDSSGAQILKRGQSVCFKIKEGDGELFPIQTGKTKVEVFFI